MACKAPPIHNVGATQYKQYTWAQEQNPTKKSTGLLGQGNECQGPVRDWRRECRLGFSEALKPMSQSGSQYYPQPYTPDLQVSA